MFSTTTALVAALAVSAQAHLFLSSPSPIPGSAPKDPLDASGSNFPCHGVSLPSSGGEHFPAGSSQLLAWDLGNGANTAVHGGGSCQMSVTYETDPAKAKDPKNWYVIYSIEGGCPSNTGGNLDGTYTGPSGTYSGALSCIDPKTNGVDCVNQFNFTIPNGLKNGHATIAWTWYNTIGNRELYMNCISAEISGGDGSEMSELPTMFVANMASVNSCPTTESTNVKFPDCGKYVTTKLPSGANMKYATTTTYPIVAPSGASCATDGAPAGGGSAPQEPSSGSALATPSSAVASSSASAPASSSGSGLVTVTTMQTVTSGSAAPSAPASAAPSAVPSSYAAPAPSSYAAPAPSGTSSSSSCSNGAVSCSNPGGVVCIGSKQFGLCNINNCAVPQELAAGTHCDGGEIRKRDHVRRHVHGVRHHGIAI